MATVERPITRSELREELDRVLTYYATKEDLAQLETRLVKEVSDLKSDLKGTLIQVIIGLAGLQLIGLGAVAAIMKLLGG